jgi:hypothetical protein
MRTLTIVAVGLLIMGAGTVMAQDVTRDYDHSTDFSKYHTFMWIKEPRPENPLMKQRIIDAVNAQLEAKGLTQVDTGADLGISANVATRQEQTLETFYDGFPGWGWNRWGGYWGGPAVANVYTYQVGTLVVDLFDTQTKQVVWWASATDTVSSNPEKNSKKLEEAVTKMFKHYPPKGTRETD